MSSTQELEPCPDCEGTGHTEYGMWDCKRCGGTGTSHAPLMAREDAMREFRKLVARYGLQWTPRSGADRAAFDQLNEINKVLTEADRREALGLSRK